MTATDFVDIDVDFSVDDFGAWCMMYGDPGFVDQNNRNPSRLQDWWNVIPPQIERMITNVFRLSSPISGLDVASH